jgi:hypothetical protein
MAFDGHTACRTVSAKSEQAALASAATNACAELVSGVTETMRCEQSPPARIRWLAKPHG